MALPIVGAHFHPPAKTLLQFLPLGTPLWLKPEPDNPYDANAIMVGVNGTTVETAIPKGQIEDFDAALEGFGFNSEEVFSTHEWHLGYIPRTIAETIKLEPGKHPAALAFGADGKPMVTTPKPEPAM